MRITSSAERAAAITGLFGQICRATPQEARTLAAMLNPAERADMALFCYGRSHLREQGRAIAAACTPGSLVAAGGAAGQALALQIDAECDTWGAGLRVERKRVSLSGGDSRV